MLKQRVITAVILLALLLPALFASSPLPFAGLTLVLISAAGWEWGRLNGLGRMGALGLGAAVAVLCAMTGFDDMLGFGWSMPEGGWWLFVLLWGLGGGLALRVGPQGWPRLPQAARVLLGLLLLWGGWSAMTQARVLGLPFILSTFCLVWAADVGAYFGGRRFGRRKLAPAISPGKSWEGVWAGMGTVLVLGLLWHPVFAPLFQRVDHSLFDALAALPLGLGLLAGLWLVAMSVVGDLFESLVKRAVGAKDSSQLLPGHGGVLDRIDALLPVFPLALALHSLT